MIVRLDQHPNADFLVLGDRLLRWTAFGYVEPIPRPVDANVTVLAPLSTVKVLAAGYAPVIYSSAFTANTPS